jgi:hypothetical protein
LEESSPQTVRQVYYALTVRGAISKTETEYQRTTVRLLTDMRERGDIPFEWIADNTRWMRKPSSFTGIAACLNATAEQYRRNLWTSMPVCRLVFLARAAARLILVEAREMTLSEAFDGLMPFAEGWEITHPPCPPGCDP